MSPIFYRLLEHVAYTQTQNASESPEHPNEKGAENLLLGTAGELQLVHPPKSVSFTNVDIATCFNQKGEAIKHPYFTSHEGNHTFLVAWIKDSSDTKSSKINVYGVYKIKGMNDISNTYANRFEWKGMVISRDLLNQINDEIIYKNGIRHLPTPDFNLLSHEEKRVKEYGRLKFQKVPISNSWGCSVS